MIFTSYENNWGMKLYAIFSYLSFSVSISQIQSFLPFLFYLCFSLYLPIFLHKQIRHHSVLETLDNYCYLWFNSCKLDKRLVCWLLWSIKFVTKGNMLDAVEFKLQIFHVLIFSTLTWDLLIWTVSHLVVSFLKSP